MSFYGSTPNYAFIWDEAGFEGTTARIREKQKAGDFKGMAAQITDDHIARFAVESTWDGLADALIAEVRRNRHTHRALQRARPTRSASSDTAPSRNASERRHATNADEHAVPLASFVNRRSSNAGAGVHSWM